MNDRKTVEQIVGDRIRRGREQLGLTQKQLGVRLGDYLEKPWKTQAVYEAEKGQRAFRAVELVAFADIFEVGVGWLVDSFPESIELPSGKTIGGEKAMSLTLVRDRYAEHVENLIASVSMRTSSISQMLSAVGEDLAEVVETLQQHAQIEDVVEAGVEPGSIVVMPETESVE
jgi:transcriptional regulator with XRE-family HTH domain